ncbi:LysR family transcriptional regulator [Sphingopyxis sp. MG]|uniref:LysR family transcriptional regulator n=1 Tax=Sphingopyxis sp. MG TaxID=1866325 RepID=UPI000CDF3A4A|nr:LysR family transcriptional regulator [Sphingopyxis sp. MG]AVA15079.1 LysR family transcriptional regulator [Sphingopyxis sp. MG]
MNLRNVDLNLLVILDALLAEQNVSRAGERIGLSQSAMSAALARLRDLFNDPLLVRVGRGLILTQNAEALIIPLREALAAIEHTLLLNREFDPKSDARSFSIAASDYAILVLLSPLVRALSEEAPNITIHLLPRSRDAPGMLRANQADIVIEPDVLFGETDFPSQPLMKDRWLCAVAAGNPLAAQKRISKAQFLDAPHAVYGIGADRQLSLADQYLLQIGVRRRIEVTVESFLLVPMLIQGTQLMALALERVAQLFPGLAKIQTIEPPYPLPEILETMYWHSRHTSDAGHRWLRERLAAVAADVVAG